MKYFTNHIIKSVFTALFLSSLVWAQVADTVFVPQKIAGVPLGAINKFILGDTTALGARNNINRVYKLHRDSIYYLNGTLTTKFPFTLIADKPDAAHKPAIVAQGVLADGKSLVVYIAASDKATFKNIYFQTAQPTGTGESTITVQLLRDSTKYMFDGCYMEWGLFLSVGVYAKSTSVTVQNCTFRNVENTTSPWNGRGISFQNNPVDTIRIINNTFFNVNSFLFQGITGVIKYAEFDHNTMVNTVKWPIHWQYMTNAKFSNNLFYNVHSYGENAADKVGQDGDGYAFGIFNVDSIPLTYGLTEASRKIKLHNNAYFYSSEVTNYWKDTLSGGSFINTRTQNMFNNNVAWPSLSELKSLNINPGFVNIGNSAAQMVDWMVKLRTKQATSYWGWDPDNDRFGVTWPLPEKLNYTNDTLLTASDGGFPVGDLNWFPDKKALWDTYVNQGSPIGGPAIESKQLPMVLNNFKAIWYVTPTHSIMDGATGLGNKQTTTFGDMGVLVRMKDGVIDAYNATGYAAENVLGSGEGRTYKIQVIGNVKTKKYTVDVTPDTGGATVRIGTDYVFRSTKPQDTLGFFGNVINELPAFGGVVGSRLQPSFMKNNYELNFVNNTDIPTQTGIITYKFTVTPSASGLNAAFGLANGNRKMDEYSGMSTIVRCNTSDNFDAYDSNAYKSVNTLAYIPGKKYAVEMVVNVATKKYNVTITPEGGSPVILATNYRFRKLTDTLNTFAKLVIIGGAFGGAIGDAVISNSTFTDVKRDDSSLPTTFELYQNYPNPFNPDTKINYQVPNDVNVNIAVFNILGQKVKTLVDQSQSVGRYSIVWNGSNDAGRNVSSGVYFYQIRAGNFVSVRKMMLMK